MIRPGQPQTIVPRSRHARTRPAFSPPPGHRSIVPIRRSRSPPHSPPPPHSPSHSPPHSPQTPTSPQTSTSPESESDRYHDRLRLRLPSAPTHTPILYPPNHPPVVPLPNHPPIPSPPHPSSTQTTPPLSAGPSRQATGIELMTPTDYGYNPPIVGSPPMVGSPTTMGSPGSVAHPFTPPAMDEGERLGWDQHLQEQQHRYHDLDSLDRRSFQN